VSLRCFARRSSAGNVREFGGRINQGFGGVDRSMLRRGCVDPPVIVFDVPPGLWCEFGVHVELSGPHNVFREFFDKNGELVRLLIAGRGGSESITNIDTGATFFDKSDGGVQHITLNPDGSYSIVTTGHIIISMLPTDVPAGPSTKLYVGRTVTTVDVDFNFTLEHSNGTVTDICALLSQ
jgi:hypothetical protein